MSSPSIVILTGAGISAESGLRTFRDNDGLWEDHRVEDVATPEAFARNPQLVHRFYNLRRQQLRQPEVKPNAGHLALAEFEKKWPGDFLLITQNVDNLHERAGSQKMWHMHGELQSVLCLACQSRMRWQEDLEIHTPCPKCRRDGQLRPDIVWFGEMPYHMEDIEKALETCDFFVAVGTSGLVYPAAGFVQWAVRAKRFEVNPHPTPVEGAFHRVWRGPASSELPKLFSELMSGLSRSH